jgi:hypothetical protein
VLRRATPRQLTIWGLILLGFAAMEFPGVLFFDDMAEPFVLGFPFIYAWNTAWWAFMCAVLLYAYKTDWGRPRPTDPSTGRTTDRTGDPFADSPGESQA